MAQTGSDGRLLQTTPQNITLHLSALNDEGEIEEAAACKECLLLRQAGTLEVQRSVRYCNFHAILVVDYRVRPE